EGEGRADGADDPPNSFLKESELLAQVDLDHALGIAGRGFPSVFRFGSDLPYALWGVEKGRIPPVPIGARHSSFALSAVQLPQACRGVGRARSDHYLAFHAAPGGGGVGVLGGRAGGDGHRWAKTRTQLG